MKKYLVIGCAVALVLYGLIHLASADDVGVGAHVRWNCENIQTTAHPLPVNLNNDGNGTWDVLLADGSSLLGTTFVQNEIRLMKWQWEDAWWWTDGVDVVYCDSDVRSISILFAT